MASLLKKLIITVYCQGEMSLTETQYLIDICELWEA